MNFNRLLEFGIHDSSELIITNHKAKKCIIKINKIDLYNSKEASNNPESAIMFGTKKKIYPHELEVDPCIIAYVTNGKLFKKFKERKNNVSFH